MRHGIDPTATEITRELDRLFLALSTAKKVEKRNNIKKEIVHYVGSVAGSNRSLRTALFEIVSTVLDIKGKGASKRISAERETLSAKVGWIVSALEAQDALALKVRTHNSEFVAINREDSAEVEEFKIKLGKIERVYTDIDLHVFKPIELEVLSNIIDSTAHSLDDKILMGQYLKHFFAEVSKHHQDADFDPRALARNLFIDPKISTEAQSLVRDFLVDVGSVCFNKFIEYKRELAEVSAEDFTRNLEKSGLLMSLLDLRKAIVDSGKRVIKIEDEIKSLSVVDDTMFRLQEEDATVKRLRGLEEGLAIELRALETKRKEYLERRTDHLDAAVFMSATLPSDSEANASPPLSFEKETPKQPSTRSLLSENLYKADPVALASALAEFKERNKDVDAERSLECAEIILDYKDTGRPLADQDVLQIVDLIEKSIEQNQPLTPSGADFALRAMNDGADKNIAMRAGVLLLQQSENWSQDQVLQVATLQIRNPGIADEAVSRTLRLQNCQTLDELNAFCKLFGAEIIADKKDDGELKAVKTRILELFRADSSGKDILTDPKYSVLKKMLEEHRSTGFKSLLTCFYSAHSVKEYAAVAANANSHRTPATPTALAC